MNYYIGDKVKDKNGNIGIVIRITKENNVVIVIKNEEYTLETLVYNEDLTLLSRPIYPKYKIGDKVTIVGLTYNYIGKVEKIKQIYYIDINSNNGSYVAHEDNLEPYKSPKEMTIKEIEKELGYTIKVVK